MQEKKRSASEETKEDKGLLSECHQTVKVVKPLLKVLCLDPPAKEEVHKSVDSKLVELNLNVETPSSQVIKRNGV